MPNDKIMRLVEDQAGRGCKVVPFPRDKPSPLANAISILERTTNHGVQVYWADHAAPRIFCIQTGLVDAIVFSPSYVEWSAALRQCISKEIRIFDDVILQSIAEGRALLCAAELELADGAIENALDLLAIGLADTSHHDVLIPWLGIDRLESEPHGIPYAAIWFFGLAHEFGHFMTPKLVDAEHAHEAFVSHVLRAAELANTPSLKAQLLQAAEDGEFIARLADEASSDATGALGLANIVFSRLPLKEISVPHLVAELDSAVWVAGWLQALSAQTARFRAQRAPQTPASASSELGHLADVFGFRARRETTARFLARVLPFMLSDDKAGPDDASIAEWMKVVTDVHRARAGHISLIGDGFDRASRYLVGLDKRDPGRARRELLQKLTDPSFRSVHSEYLSGFHARAQRAGQADPYLDNVRTACSS